MTTGAERQQVRRPARGGVMLIAVGAVLLLLGGVNVMERGAPFAFLVAVLGVGLLVGGLVVRALSDPARQTPGAGSHTR